MAGLPNTVTSDRDGEFQDTERFKIRRRIGEGAFGIVYEAWDRERNAVVALKTLRNSDPGGLYRFKQEFRSLADITHPNLVTLYELLTEGDTWFFTMELVQGIDFLSYARGRNAVTPTMADSQPTMDLEIGGALTERASGTSARSDSAHASSPTLTSDRFKNLFSATAPAPRVRPPLREELLRAALGQLCAGLSALHEAGKLHRDIKPSNVLVTRDGRVVILDFGLVSELLADDADADGLEAHLVGTPEYMSPEQASAAAVAESTDWYSVGVMIYEAITGRLPFTGSISTMLAEKILRDPPLPNDVMPSAPEDLAGLAMSLLMRDPSGRPTGRDLMLKFPVDTTSIRSRPQARSRDRAVPLIGRTHELSALWSAFDEVRAQRGVAAYVRGRSGLGKTTLVKRFLADVRRRVPETVILAGHCYEQESVPFKALDSLIDALTQHLRTLPSQAIQSIVPANAHALTRLFPVLRALALAHGETDANAVADAHELRHRAFGALHELLSRLAQRGPLILFIDNLQWGDADSAALLDHLLRPPDAPALLMLATYRIEDLETSPLLQSLRHHEAGAQAQPGVRLLDVGELPHEEALELARSLIGAQGAAVDARAESVARESKGNPFFIDELVRHALARAEARTSERVSQRPGPIDATRFALDEVIWERVQRLSEPALRLLEIVAVAGKPVEFGVVRRAAGLSGAEFAAVAALRVEHLLRTRGLRETDSVETFHDRIRESVVAHLGPEQLRDCHGRLALALEATGRSDHDTLAYHFRGAGDRVKASVHAGKAAARAAESLAFDQAARLYRLAIELRPSFDAEARTLSESLGDVLNNAGRGRESAAAYLAAAEGADPLREAALRRRAADPLLRSGHIDEGIAELRKVLKNLGLALAPTPRRALLSLLLLRGKLKLRGLGFRERPESQISARELLVVDACKSAAQGLGIVDNIRAAEFNTRHLLAALELGEPFRVARALAFEVAFTASGGSSARRESESLIERTMALARRVENPNALGLALMTSGIAACLQGRFRLGLERSSAAVQILEEKCVAPWDLAQALLYEFTALSWLGEFKRLATALPARLESYEHRHDLMALTSLRTYIEYLPKLAADDPDGAESAIVSAIERWGQKGFLIQHWWGLKARAQCALYSRDPTRGYEILANCWPALKRSLLLRVQYARVETLQLRGRMALAAAADGGWRRPIWLNRAENDALSLAREPVAWSDGLGSLLRAGIDATRARPERALAHLAHAERTLAEADMWLHVAVARRRRGEIQGGDGGRELIAAADRAMLDQDIRNPTRMAALLAPGRWTR